MNRQWIAQGMPARCAVPETESAWRETLRMLPGYDPFDSEEAKRRGYYFDCEDAYRYIGFIHDWIKHTKGEWARKPVWLEPWQQSFVGNLFGWKRPDGTRRYREAFLFLPRKNGKTTLVQALAMCAMLLDGEEGAECYCAAADRDQARLLFEPLKTIIGLETGLSNRLRVYQHQITYHQTSSFIKAISAESHTKHGYNSHFIVVDELHAQPDRELVDVLRTSTGSRRQPLLVFISTSDFERTGSICNETQDFACKVRDGVVDDPAFLPALYGADPSDEWADESVWHRANPNLGVSISLEYLRSECAKARETPAYENTFKRLHLNIRTEQDVRWIPIDRWDACGDTGHETPAQWRVRMLRELAGSGRRAWGGLDLSSTRDLTALVLIFENDDGPLTLLPWFWIPGDTADQRVRQERVPYDVWIREGFVEKTEGDVIDQDLVIRRIGEICEPMDMGDIGFDRWGAEHVERRLQEASIRVCRFGQGYTSMSEPTKELERRILAKGIEHGGNPVLRWMASGMSITADPAGNIKPNKKNSKVKIDGIVASVMALGRMMSGDVRQTESVYEKRGIITL